MAKIHWDATDKTPACNRSRTNWRTVNCPAGEYLPAEQSDPEKYCCRCAKLCKLSMLGTRAICSANTRTDSDRYAELRKLVEAWQSHTVGSSQTLADWSHR